jgi:hypothetical protein
MTTALHDPQQTFTSIPHRAANVRSKSVRIRPRRNSFIWEYRINVKEYMSETTAADREHLRETLNEALCHYLSLKRPIYLEKLGILTPELFMRPPRT